MPHVCSRALLRLCAIGACLAAAAGAQAPPAGLIAHRIGPSQGISSVTIADIHQSADGFVWAATDAGLDRYDGYQVRTYRFEPGRTTSLSHPQVHAIADAPGGKLWVGTYGGGLNRFDPATDTAIRHRSVASDPSTPSDDRVTVLTRDRAGRLWMGMRGGLDLVDEATGRVDRRRVQLGTGDDGFSVRDIANAAEGHLWIGGEGGLVRYDPERRQIRARWHEQPAPPVFALASVADGGVWVGFNGQGLARLDAQGRLVARFRADPADPSALCGSEVHDLTLDSNGALWVATQDGGLCRLDTATRRFTRYPARPDNPRALVTNRTRSLLVDRGGVVWVGTWSGGLHALRTTPFLLVQTVPEVGFRSRGVMGLAEAPGGLLWVGTSETGLYLYDPVADRATQPSSWPAGLRSGVVRAFAEAPDGSFYVGGVGGVFRRGPGATAFVPVPVDPPEGHQYASTLDLAQGPDGSLWMASYGGGLCRLRPGEARFTCLAWEGDRDLRSRTVYSVYPDRDGRVWVSYSGQGVDLVDPVAGRVATYDARPDHPDALAASSVITVRRTSRGELWMATYGGGLSRFDPALGGGQGGFTHVTTAEGLPDLITYSVIEDAHGDLWVPTNRGLARLAPDGRVRETFGMDDGLQAEEFNANARLRLSDGRLAFGGIDGINLFDPASIHPRTFSPPLAVTGLRVLGIPTPVPGDVLVRGLRLHHTQSALSLEFAALDYHAPARNLFSFRLEGVDAQWSPPSTRRTADYTNLAPGRYRLHVRAAVAGGTWGEPATIPIVVTPAWWQTRLVRLLALLVALGGLVAGVRVLAQRRLRETVRTLETQRRLADERARISRDLHDHVGAQLSSVLAGIEVARLARRAGRPPAPDDPLDTLEGDAREAMRQLRESIWALHDEAITVADFGARVEADLHSRVRGRTRPVVRVEQCAHGARILGPLVALHLYRLVREAVTNSLKHAHAETLVVTLAEEAGTLVVTIADDGCFAGASGDGSVIGGDGTDVAGPSGFGMDSMRSRAAALGAALSIDTADGTTVTVRIPFDRLTGEGDAPAPGRAVATG